MASITWVAGGVGRPDMGVRNKAVFQCERVGQSPDIGASTSFLEPTLPSSSLLETTMRCSGGSKCNCTLFQGGRRATRCQSCRHNRESHYESSNDNDSSDDHSGCGNDTNGTDDGDDNEDDNDSDTERPSASKKNKITVSSLLADLTGSGEHPRVEVENAEREAKAGLTRRQVGLIFNESWSRKPSLRCHAVWIKVEGKPGVGSGAERHGCLASC